LEFLRQQPSDKAQIEQKKNQKKEGQVLKDEAKHSYEE